MYRKSFKPLLPACLLLLAAVLTACAPTPPGLTVSGRLADADGEPLEGREIVLGRYINFTDEFHSFSIPYTNGSPIGNETETDGTFRITAEDHGTYLLLFEGVIEAEISGLRALTDDKGNLIVVELSENAGANVGTVFLSNYRNLPLEYLPDLAAEVFLGMRLEDLESQPFSLIATETAEGRAYYESAGVAQGIDRVVYGFDQSGDRLEELEVWYTEKAGAYAFGEAAFGIPNYQAASSDGQVVIYWRFHHGDDQVIVAASGSKLKYQVREASD